ncbi:MAG: hypothetical protein IPJ24_00770 [bacterium]|nr:hypothetical protein [bacterium]
MYAQHRPGRGELSNRSFSDPAKVRADNRMPVLARDVVARSDRATMFTLGAAGAFATAVRAILKPFAPSVLGACHAILDSDSDRFRDPVATVIVRSSTR